MRLEAVPESRCVGICLLDPATGYCRGCMRNVAEIAQWYEASAAEKRAILARLDQRRVDRRPLPKRECPNDRS